MSSPLQNGTYSLSTRNTPTIHKAFSQGKEIESKLELYCADPSLPNSLKYATEQMAQKFSKYFDPIPLVYIIGCFLDPRYKLSFLNFCDKDINKVRYKAQVKEIKRIFSHYYEENKNRIDQIETNKNAISSISSKQSNFNSNQNSFMSDFRKIMQVKRKHQRIHTTSLTLTAMTI